DLGGFTLVTSRTDLAEFAAPESSSQAPSGLLSWVSPALLFRLTRCMLCSLLRVRRSPAQPGSGPGGGLMIEMIQRFPDTRAPRRLVWGFCYGLVLVVLVSLVTAVLSYDLRVLQASEMR